MSNSTITVNRPSDPASILTFALSQVYVYFGIVVIAYLLHFAMKHIHRATGGLQKGHEAYFWWYMEAKHRFRRNIITYFLQLLVTTICMIAFFIYGFPLLLVPPSEPIILYLDRIDKVIYFGIWLVCLYLWELSYKILIGIELCVHHVATLLFVCIAAEHFFVTLQWLPIYGFVLLGTTALTEQPTFLALLLYRMERWKLAGQFFFWGAIWTLICKIALTVTTVYFWGFNVNLFVSGNPRYESLVMWVYLFWFLIIPLFVSQIYAAVIMFKLWKVCEKKAALAERDELETLTREKTSQSLQFYMKQRSLQEISRGPSTNTIGAFTSYNGDLTSSLPDNELAPFASSFSAPPSQQQQESEWDTGVVALDGATVSPIPVPTVVAVPAATGSLKRILVDSSVMEKMPF